MLKKILILCALIALAYFPVVSAYQTVSPDAQFILPFLDNISGLGDYFEKLFTFKTLDFQPIRDLSLGLDLFIFNHFDINTFIIQNILLWVLSCLIIFNIQKILLPQVDELKLFVLNCGFALYPLFVATLSWSMARKHILAFLFILLATQEFLKNNRSTWRMNLYYLLSILSQPITILWPFWCVAYERKNWKSLWPTSLIFVFVSVANWLYYSKGEMFNFIYQSKTSDAFNIPDKILAFGHYMYQLLVPYYQTFFYDLGHWSIWVGIILTGLLILLYRSFKFSNKLLGIWSLYGLLPIVVVLNTPKTKSDTYLLLPAFALFILLNHLYALKPFKIKWLIPLLSFWLVFDCIESRYWIQKLAFAVERNYERRPTCMSAINAAKTSYSLEVQPSSELLNYMQINECLRPSTPYEMIDFMALHTQILYYQNGTTTLQDYARTHWYPRMIYAALLIKNNQPDLTINELGEVNLENTQPNYDPIIAKIVHPFCIGKECQKISEKFIIQKKKPNI